MSEPADINASRAGPAMKLRRERLLRGADIREAGLIGLGMALTRFASSDLWSATADGMSRRSSLRRRRYSRFAERTLAFYGDAFDAAEQKALWYAMEAAVHRRRFATVAEWSGATFAPQIDVEGVDHVRQALAGGRGVILWLDNFINHQVIGKRGLHQAGIAGWQVSWTRHGFSSSRLGKRYLNPVQIAAEARYLDGRIEFDANSALVATRRITRALAGNDVVRITNNAYIGRKFVEAPVGPGCFVPIATTPLNLSLKLGAPLLPVATLELKPLKHYRVAIAPPLDIGAAAEGEANFSEVAARYGAYLRPLVEAHPEQWRAWMGGLRPASRPAP